MPTGDTYDWLINGVTIATISSVGLGLSATSGAGNLTMNENFITMDDIATPANPGTGQRRIFVDTSSGELSVRTSGGTTVSLEGAAQTTFDDDVFTIQDNIDNTRKLQFQTGGISASTTRTVTIQDEDATMALIDGSSTQIFTQDSEFVDNAFRIRDNIDNTRKLEFQTGGIAASTTRTWTAQNASGTVALLDSGDDQVFSDLIRPDTDGTRNFGGSSNHWNTMFSEEITFKGTSGPATSTTPYITTDASDMIFNTPSGDGWLWRSANATLMQWTQDGAEVFIRAGAAKVMGFVVSNANVTLGTSGTKPNPGRKSSFARASVQVAVACHHSRASASDQWPCARLARNRVARSAALCGRCAGSFEGRG